MGKTPQFVVAEEKQLQVQPDSQPFPGHPPANPWRDMADVPRDGRLVELAADLADESGVQSVWYVARGSGRPWVAPKSGWMGVEPRQWVPFEPAGWRFP